ncbi:tetratricopeptide repeat protein [Novosphingobium sp. G106]|uniref:O-linked N-acetylglucosamine transferase, SPINDLY family protein n=1 Tax=Novosphingobium sp. G106 TaxID=2849500 RepID=UPI001C2CDD6A|nr:glycosyltransferase family 41 protein [Novosphingobium sp. G106]MBV1687518.1 tetratricopeptide repeat protein [Novosphingobium sp. G106]
MTNFQDLLSPPVQAAPQAELDALVALYSQSRMDEALDRVADLIRRYPACEVTHNISGVVAAGAGKLDAAVMLHDMAIAMAPDYFEAFNNRGNALKTLKRYDEALESFAAAIALKPDYFEAHLNRGIVLRLVMRFDEALDAIGAALHYSPNLLQAYSNRGNVFQDIHRFDEALADYDRALEIDPRFVPAHINRGNVLRVLVRRDEALACYDTVIALAPGNGLAHRGRGGVLKDLTRLPEAVASFEQAYALDPTDAQALCQAMSLRAQMGDWSLKGDGPGAEVCHRMAEGKAVSPFQFVAISDDAELQLANARTWAKRFTQQPPFPAMPRAPGEKIKIGYFSGDFHNHATMWLMIGMLERHDRARFEIHAFSDGPEVQDEMRARAMGAVDGFHDLRSLGDAAAAQLARAIGIDIAVDLKGYTQYGRLGIFAQRAAPIQVSYLGYPGTVGMDCIDYLIADRIVVPEDHQAFYAENILYLPDCYQVNDSERAVSTKVFTRTELNLPDDAFVFCCLNNNYKVTPSEFDIWMRLLSRVEGSVLWLLADNAWAADNLRREAEARGVDGSRLTFAGRAPMEEHLARQRCADLFLDTFNYNAHTTASDALWVGLPLITKLGASFPSRVAGSLLHAVGLPELVTESAEAYEALAYDLATDPARLAEIRARLAANRTTTPLFDTELFTRNIEQAFEQIVAAA